MTITDSLARAIKRSADWILKHRKRLIILSAIIVFSVLLTAIGHEVFESHKKTVRQQNELALKAKYSDARAKTLSGFLAGLDISDMQMRHRENFPDGEILASGRIVNNSKYSYTYSEPGGSGRSSVGEEGGFAFALHPGLLLNVVVYDCPQQAYQPNCLIIYDSNFPIATSIPRGQARDIKIPLADMGSIEPKAYPIFEFDLETEDKIESQLARIVVSLDLTDFRYFVESQDNP